MVLAGERALAWQDQRQRVTDEKDAAAAATIEVEGLIGISRATSREDMDELLDGATAGFRSELEEQAGRLRKALTAKGSDEEQGTEASVSAAGVVSSGGREEVVVLLFLTQTTTAKGARSSVTGSRVEVTLMRSGGDWKIAGLHPM